MAFLQSAFANNLKLSNFDFENYARIFANNTKVSSELMAVKEMFQVQNQFQQQRNFNFQSSSFEQSSPRLPKKSTRKPMNLSSNNKENRKSNKLASKFSNSQPVYTFSSLDSGSDNENEVLDLSQKSVPFKEVRYTANNNIGGRSLLQKQRYLIEQLLEQTSFPSNDQLREFYDENVLYFDSVRQVQLKVRRIRQKLKPSCGTVEKELALKKKVKIEENDKVVWMIKWIHLNKNNKLCDSK